MSVLVVLEQNGGKWNRMSFEALAAGKTMAEALGVPLNAAVIGASVEGLAKDAAAYPAAKVTAVQHELLANYTPDGYTSALEQLIKAEKTKAVVFPHTYQVRDYAPKLATRFGQAFVSDVVDLKAEGGTVSFIRQLFQGKLNATIAAKGEPQFVSVQAGAFRAAEAGDGAAATVETFAPQLDAGKIRSKPEEPFREAQRSVDLSAAELNCLGRARDQGERQPARG